MVSPDPRSRERTAVYTRDDDPAVVEHAEMRWPQGGGVMLGTAGKDGATVVRDLRDEDYGSRGFSVRDPEGNLWSFGAYAGEDAPA